MQNRGMSGLAPSSSLRNSSITNQPSPGAQSYTSPHLPQSGVSMKQSTEPSVGALQAGLEVQAEPARQTVPHMVTTAINCGKDNLAVSPPTPCPEHQPMGRRPKSQLMGSTGMSDAMGNTVAAIEPPQIMPNPPGPSLNMPSIKTQALKKLFHILKCHKSQQKQQILATLKSDSEVLAAFIKQRTAQQHHLPQPGVGMKQSTEPSVGAFQAAQEVQAEPDRQTVPHMVTTAVHYGKDNLAVSPPTPSHNLIATQQQMQPHQSPEHQQMGQRPKSQLMGSSGMSDSMGNTVAAIGPPQIMPNSPGPSLNMPRRKALKKLLHILKSHTPQQKQLHILKSHKYQQKQQFLAILKSDPKVMAAFIKQRKLRTAVQQQ